ncbi:hypothetical protein H2203_008552 [Taxawa tesnikishii (nom. ined.)]|nr:hypothetical protein H2203_008552 [Dothideales sp. JES 119]
MASEPSAPSLTATYASPVTTQTFSSALPSLPAPGSEKTSSVEEKSAYLSALRLKVSELQNDVNSFLTQKMEEDKAREAEGRGDAAGGKSVRIKDEDREEEMYGEEDAGE